MKSFCRRLSGIFIAVQSSYGQAVQPVGFRERIFYGFDHMKLTQPKKVIDIVRPPLAGMALDPRVTLADPVSRSVELMLQHDLRMIAVVDNNRLVGHIQLSEALHCLGLHQPKYPGSGLPRTKDRKLERR